MHEDTVPPKFSGINKSEKEFAPWATEYDVCSELCKIGHEVKALGVQYDLKIIRDTIDEFKPHLVFNLLEEFQSQAIFDQNIVSYLELLKMPYTGCNPRGLILARDKALAKKILSYHRIKTSNFFVIEKGKKIFVPKNIQYPLIIKCLNEEASMGLGKASVVTNEEKLKERVKFVHESCHDDAIIEDFIEGREFFVGVYGHKRLKALPAWELFFKNVENPQREFYSSRAKFNSDYRSKKGINTGKAKIKTDLESRLQTLAKKVYKRLGLSGYARIDFRVTDSGDIYILEANPNPNIAKDDEFALSAHYLGLDYSQLLKKIISQALSSSL